MPYRRMTKPERYEAIGMIRAGMPVADIATHFLVCKKTIQRLVARFNQTGNVADRARSGRPRKTTDAEDRMIRTAHLRNRTRTATQTAREWAGNNRISRHIVRRRLKNQGITVRNRLSQKGMQPLQQREEEYCGLLPLSHMTVLEGTGVNNRARSLSG